MKTFNLVLITAAMALAIGTASAQEKKEKICIKVVKNVNGEVTSIDSCFNDMESARACMKKCGMESEINVDELNSKGGKCNVVKVNSKDGKTNCVTKSTTGSKCTAVIVNDNSGNGNIKNEDTEITVDEKGNVLIKSTDGGDQKEMQIMIDSLGGSQMIEELIKEMDKDGKPVEKKIVKVIVIKKIDVTDLTANERKALPAGIDQKSTKSLDDLKIFAAQGNLNISFSPQTKSAVTINMVDINGKMVLVEKENASGTNFSKSININTIPAGIYFIQVVQDDKAETKKIVISETSK